MVVVGAFKAKLGGSGGDGRRLQEGITDSDCTRQQTQLSFSNSKSGNQIQSREFRFFGPLSLCRVTRLTNPTQKSKKTKLVSTVLPVACRRLRVDETAKRSSVIDRFRRECYGFELPRAMNWIRFSPRFY
jgi:hypothetical protein